MTVKTLYQCDEPGCVKEGREGEELFGWTSIPDVYVLGEMSLSRRHIVLCPAHRPIWAGEGGSDMDATLASMKEQECAK